MGILQMQDFKIPPLFLMDGTAFIYRSFYANRHLQRSDGFPTNALALVTRLLLRILRMEKPEYFLFAMDGKGKNFRHEIYDQYKANREAMPEDLALQMEPIKAMVQALGLKLEVCQGYEADDCIASMAAKFQQQRPVIIISGDKDLKQCLTENTFMWDPASKDEKLLTMAEFEAETGVSPAMWPDMQALIGDSSDNIPGVPGIGPKSATEIFKICPSLEDIKEHLERLPLKFRQKLEPHLEEMFRWRRLTTLKKDACSSLDLQDMVVGQIDLSACNQLAREYELIAIGSEIGSLAKARLAAPVASEKVLPVQDSLIVAQPELSLPTFATVTELPSCASYPVSVIWEKEPTITLQVAVDAPHQNREFIWEGKMADLCEWLQEAAMIITPDLKAILRSSPSWQKLLAKVGIERFIDLGLASYLLNPEDGDYGWRRISARWRETLGDSEPGAAAFALVMAQALNKNLQAYNLDKLYQQIEMPLIPVLVKMEELGFAIEPAAFQKFLGEVDTSLNLLTEEIYEAVGEKFNIRSSRQLGEALFNRLGLASGKKTRTGLPSTSEVALEKLAKTHPVVEKVLQFRKLDKIQGTYLEPLPRLMDPQGRIHSTFNQEVTATGRISSSNPNLQNIPVRGEMGQRMRQCFVAGPGKLLVAVDYSQIELRLLAHLSQDANLLQAFRSNEDIHSRTAALIFETDATTITPDQRRMAKTINFGLLYGMGSRKLAQELKIGEAQASEFIRRYFARLSGLKKFYEEILAGARVNGYVSTMGGRRRWLPGITSANGQISAQAERQAVNAVTQGTAADIIKMAMIAVDNDVQLKDWGARLVLQVHDELLLEAPEANARAVCDRTVDLMQNVRPGGVELTAPLLADWGIGQNWAEAH